LAAQKKNPLWQYVFLFAPSFFRNDCNKPTPVTIKPYHMPVSQTRITYLLQQYAADICTRQELLELLEAIDEAKTNEALQDALQTI